MRCFCIEYTTWINLMSWLARRSSQATNPVRFSQHIPKNLYLLSCLHYRPNEWITHGFLPNIFFCSPLHPDANPCCQYLLVRNNTQTMVLLCIAHHYNSFCLFPNEMLPIPLYLFSEHASFFLISKVLIIYFAECACASTNARLVLFVVARLWGNGMRSGLYLRQRRKNNNNLKR